MRRQVMREFNKLGRWKGYQSDFTSQLPSLSFEHFMCESISTARIPQGNPKHLSHDDSRGPGNWQLIVSQPPGHLQTTTNLFCNIRCHFQRHSESRVSSSQTLSFLSRWRAFIDHKRPIKAIEPFALSFFSQSDSFCDLFYAVLLSWNSYVY